MKKILIAIPLITVAVVMAAHKKSKKLRRTESLGRGGVEYSPV